MLNKNIPQRILFIQLADMGDLLLATPAIAAVRQAYPDAHLALFALPHSAKVIENAGLVDEIITFERVDFNNTRSLFKPANLRHIFDLRHGHYDTLIFLHHFTLKLGTLKFALISLATRARYRLGLQNGNGWFLTDSIPDEGFGVLHQAEYWLKLVGRLDKSGEWQVASGEKLHTRFPELFPQQEKTPPSLVTHHPSLRIIVHAGSGGYSVARRWSPEAFAQVADALVAELGAEIVLVGSKHDDSSTVKTLMQSPAYDLTGKTSLTELAAVLRSGDLFIGADSGVMHMAAAVGTPIVAIFGSSNHAAWHPYTPHGQHVIVRSAPLCSPCSYVDHHIGLRDGCEARTCMKMVTSAQVIEAAKRIVTSDERRGTKNVGTQSIAPSPEKSVTRGLPTSSQPPSPHGDFPHPQPLPISWGGVQGEGIITILGYKIAAITYPAWLDLIAAWVKDTNTRVHQICTINPEFMVMARRDVHFHHILQRCEICIPDGVGLLWAARFLGERLPQRVTGSDGVPLIAERAAKEGWRLFLLGAAPGVADAAAKVLTERYPNLQIAGIYSGSPSADEEDALVERINASHADILLVAYGAPNQDKWIARNTPRLQVKVAMGVGGTFDFIAGIVPRAPLWMRQMGLEWLYRLILQPWRIRRMLRLPIFVLYVLLYGKRPLVR